MNKIYRMTVFSLLAVFIFSACTKQVNKIYFEGGTAPVLTLTALANIEFANADKTALELSWTNPDYQLTTGTSSQDVNYNIQIDTVGSNFSHPYEITVSKEQRYSFTGGEFNDVMQNQMNLSPAIEHALEIKVIASMANNSVPLESNTIQYAATPYVIPPKVALPSTGHLFIVGSAVGSWDNPIPPANVDKQEFEQVSPTEYTITVEIIGGGSYKLIGENDGSWAEQWGTKNKNDPETVNGGDFIKSGEDVLAPPQTAIYKIDVDFQKGKFTVTQQ